jgi:hypothetical protein
MVQARALKTAGELGRTDMVSDVVLHLQDPEEKCQFYAAWSALLLGENTAIDFLKTLSTKQHNDSQRACDLVCRKAEPVKILKTKTWTLIRTKTFHGRNLN